MKQIDNLNLDNFWIPFTANNVFKQNPRLLVEAQGMYYKTEDDRELLVYGVVMPVTVILI